MSDAKSPIRPEPPAPVIVISSLVSGDAVGGMVTQAVLQQVGLRPVLVPTVLMGRHPGRGVPSGGPVEASQIASMLSALERSGTVSDITVPGRFANGAIFTGYFANAAAFIARTRARHPDIPVWVDPILGDGPGRPDDAGLYVKPDVARAIRDQLLPLADVITPNLFELAWLTGRTLSDDAEAESAVSGLPCDALVTSAPAPDGRIGVMIKSGELISGLDTARQDRALNGTGDLFAATALAVCSGGASLKSAASFGAKRVAQILSLSAGLDQLMITPLTLQVMPDMSESPRRFRFSSTRPAWAMGLDGAPGGWCAVMIDMNTLQAPRHQLFATFQDALDFGAQIMAIDMPMGFADTPGPRGMRACEYEARSLLGPRRSSIFPSPLRPALAAETYEAALAANRAAGGKGISKQAWNLFPKLREIDALNAPTSDGFLFETHPETSFTVITGAPAAHSKKTPEGREERLALLHRQGLPRDLFEPHPYRRKDVQGDDLIDAGLCVLTALRIAEGTARCLPEDPPRDGRGLRMAIFA